MRLGTASQNAEWQFRVMFISMAVIYGHSVILEMFLWCWPLCGLRHCICCFLWLLQQSAVAWSVVRCTKCRDSLGQSTSKVTVAVLMLNAGWCKLKYFSQTDKCLTENCQIQWNLDLSFLDPLLNGPGTYLFKLWPPHLFSSIHHSFPVPLTKAVNGGFTVNMSKHTRVQLFY
jgi:hypothetical protein